MTYLLKVVSGVLFVIGALLVLGGVGTVDYYTLELGQSEPTQVWTNIFVGFSMMVPALIYLIYKYRKEMK